MKRLLAIAFVGLIFAGCAALQTVVQPRPQYGELTMHYADGDVITYLLPPEFPQMDEEQIQYVAVQVSSYLALCLRQVIDGNKYGIFVVGEDAVIFGAAMIVGDKDSWWIYIDGKPSNEVYSYVEFKRLAEQLVEGLMTPKTEA